MYPTFRIADSSYVFGAPYSEEVKRRSGIFSTSLTMANADTDGISLDLKSNFAAIAAARPIPHLELLCRFLMAASRTTRGHDPTVTANAGEPLFRSLGDVGDMGLEPAVSRIAQQLELSSVLCLTLVGIFCVYS